MKYLSCDINNIVPSNSNKDSSSISLVSISIWLVGSSSIKKFDLSNINSNSLILTFSPPLIFLSFLSISSLPK